MGSADTTVEMDESSAKVATPSMAPTRVVPPMAVSTKELIGEGAL